MARPGKREKIIAGFVIGVVAIGAVHFLIFQDKIERYNTRRGTYEAKKSQAMGLPQMPNARDLQEYREKTQADLRTFWKAVYDLGLIWPIYYMPVSDPPPLQNPGDQKAAQEYQRKKAEAERRRREFSLAAISAVADRLEALIRQKRAYERGKAWQGDPEVGGSPLTNKMKLSFLGRGNPTTTKRWNLPMSLPKGLNDQARLWDEVNRLYELWDMLDLLSEQMATYQQQRQKYTAQLKTLGINVGTLDRLKKENGALSQFVRLLQARLIWEQREPGKTPIVGTDEPLTLDLLMRMFGFDLEQVYAPRDPATGKSLGLQPPQTVGTMLLTLNAPLVAIQRMLPLARKSGIEDMQRVEIFGLNPLVKYAATAAKRPEDNRREAGGKKRRNLAPAGGEGGARGSDAASALEGREDRGLTALIKLGFTGTNESVMRFLFELTHVPQYYRLHDLDITSVPGAEEKVSVKVTVECMYLLHTITYPGAGVISNDTGLPLPVAGGKHSVGIPFYRKYRKELIDAGLDTYPAVEKALREANLWNGSVMARVIAYDTAPKGKGKAKPKAGGPKPPRPAQPGPGAPKGGQQPPPGPSQAPGQPGQPAPGAPAGAPAAPPAGGGQ